jgi:cobalt-zinc-cadmium efflux system membrane fusion protein
MFRSRPCNSTSPTRSDLFATPRHWLAAIGVCCVAAVAAVSPAAAHEGHDLEPAAAVAAVHALPRLTATSETYELVAVLDGIRLTIYLDRFRDNAPVTGAAMTVTVNDEAVAAQPAADGTYALASRQFESGGVVELVFDIKASDGDDLLIGKLALPPVAAGISASMPWYTRAVATLRHGAEDHLMLMTLMLLAGLVAGIGLRRKRAGALAILLAPLVALATIATGGVARAHDGHDDAAPAVPMQAAVARRLADGRVFVPKPTQRILDVRTVTAKPETLPKAVVFVGRIIVDPNRSGLVQSITGGRVIAPAQGLPRIGQAVTRDEVLASIEPPMPIADRTTISERIGELEQGIAVAEAKLKRLHAMAERGVAPQSLVVETEAELEGLYRRREVVREARVAPEVLRAPADGVVAAAHVVAGQVVQAQDVLFQIVDPKSLWIEAYDYGDADPASAPVIPTNATAVAGGAFGIKLAFQGSSRTLQQQATVHHFAIVDPAQSLRVGQPVTVTAQRGGSTTGIIIDRDAVVRGGNGETVVWRHAEAEYFEPRPVRTEPFDATHVLIAAGIADGERIVVRGAELINQVR